MSETVLLITFVSLVCLVAVSGFFSGSETGMMALNRYRLRHMCAQGHRGALRASKALGTARSPYRAHFARQQLR